MNFLKNHGQHLAGAGLLAVAILASGWLYFDMSIPSKAKAHADDTIGGHTCSMHAQGASPSSSACPSTTAGAAKEDHAHSSSASDDAGCCAKQNVTALKLPPGHPPIPGFTVETAPVPQSAVSQEAKAR